MAQNIGLVITLGGVEKVISSIEQLETAINSAREQLRKTTVPGSAEFKALANDIRIADSRLKDLKKSSEGLEFEQKLEGFAKLGGSITAGFAAATAAVNLFGGDTEKVSEAAAKAQNILTIALTARSVAEGVAGLKTVALTVQTIAQTAATTAATTATRAFYTTLAANPLGAVLAIIGLVITAVISLTGATEDATDAEEEYQKALAKGNAERQYQITLLESQGATEENILKKKLEFAKQDEEAAKNALARAQSANRFSEETEKRREEAQNAERERILAQQRLDTFYTNQAKKNSDELEKTRKDNAAKERDRVQGIIELRLTELKGLEAITKQVATLSKNESEFENILRRNRDAAQGYANALQSLRTFGAEYNSLQLTLEESSDNFYKVFEDLRLGAENYFDVLSNGTLPLEEIQKQFKTLRDEAFASAVAFNLSPQQKQLLTDYAEGYSTLYEVLSDYQQPPFDLKDYEKLIVDLSLAQGKISLDPFERTPEEIAKTKVNISAFFSEVEKEFLSNYVKLKLPEITAGITDPEALAKARQGLEEVGKSVFANLVSAGQQIVVFEEGSEKTNESIKKLNVELQLLAKNAREGFVIQNIEKLGQQFEIPLENVQANREKLLALEKQITSKRFDQEKVYREDVEQLEQELLAQGIDITEFNYATKLMILQKFLQKEVEATESAEEKKRTSFKKTIQDIEQTIAQFQSVLNSLSQVVADYYSLQLQELELQNKAILEQVVGDTEVANKKRLEQQEIYEKQREELEKEAAKRTLQIQLAQAVANTAQAITRVFAQDGTIGFITAGLVAAANAIQIGLITQQLSAVSSYARGGFIKGQGGLVVGPSHEQGGVKFAQGGIELEGGEAVINRQSSLQYGALLNSINMVGGGKPLVVNNAFDDSRLLEALAKQKTEPIRAYVLEGDITEKQNVSRRLEQLSQF
jgi:hypothetical protein